MKHIKLMAFLLPIAFFGAGPLMAGPGHDHGIEEASSGASKSNPRFVLESKTYEAVGILNGEKVEVYVDFKQTSQPVQADNLALVLDGLPVPLEPLPEGIYRGKLQDHLHPRYMPVELLVMAGKKMEQMKGELVIEGDTLSHGHSDEKASGSKQDHSHSDRQRQPAHAHEGEHPDHDHHEHLEHFWLAAVAAVLMLILGWALGWYFSQRKAGQS